MHWFFSTLVSVKESIRQKAKVYKTNQNLQRFITNIFKAMTSASENLQEILFSYIPSIGSDFRMYNDFSVKAHILLNRILAKFESHCFLYD